jgi:hypothetical protein
MKDDEPRAEYVDHVVEIISVGNAVERCAAGENKEEDLGYGAESGYMVSWRNRPPEGWELNTYGACTRGIIRPVLSVSTRKMYGIMERMLWCEENGVSQCTARFRIQTTRTGRLIGSTHNIVVRIECE